MHASTLVRNAARSTKERADRSKRLLLKAPRAAVQRNMHCFSGWDGFRADQQHIHNASSNCSCFSTFPFHFQLTENGQMHRKRDLTKARKPEALKQRSRETYSVDVGIFVAVLWFVATVRLQFAQSKATRLELRTEKASVQYDHCCRLCSLRKLKIKGKDDSHRE